ncbi:MAG TPA: CHAT domain-containing protein [Coleofasciculaceae cyanobacterium]
MLRIIGRWLRLSLLLLASTFLCLGFHAYSIENVNKLAVAVETSLVASSSQEQLVQQGVERYQAGKFTEAIALWQQALPQISAVKDRAIVLTNLALAYQQIGKLGDAIAQWEQAIQIYRSQGDQATYQPLAKLLVEQAQAYSDLGQQRRAIPLLQSAIEITRQSQEQLTQSAAQGALGNAHWALGNYDQALAAHQESLKIARELNNASYIATALNNLGNVYVSRATRYAYQANLAGLEGDQTEEARLNQVLLQDRAEARKSFEQSVQAAQGVAQLEEVRGLMNLNRLVLTHQLSVVNGNSQEQRTTDKGQLTHSEQDLILRNFNRARELLQAAPDSRDKAYALINLAEQVLNVEKRLQVETSKQNLHPPTLLEQALAVARTIGDARAESFALGSLGQSHQAAGDWGQAMELTRKAQFAAQQVNAPDSLYRWQWQIGRILKGIGAKEQAIAAYEQAIATLQTIRGDLVVANKDLQLDFREQVEPVYRELIALLLESTSEQSHEQKSTKSQRQRIVNLSLTQLSVDSPSRRGINSTADSSSPFQWTKTFMNSGVSPLKRTSAVSQGINSLADKHSAARSQFNANSDSAASPISKVINTLELLKLAELQNFFGDECVQVALSQTGNDTDLTDANIAVVYSVILDNQTEMILRSPNGSMTAYPVAMGKQEIEKEIDQLRYFLELRQTEQYLPQVQNVYNLLIRPMEADLAAIKPSTVVFIHDGVLRKVPMAALHDGKDYLVQKYAIATTPSLSLTPRKPLERRNLEALSLGLTVEKPPFAPLTYVQAEVKAVKQILGGTNLVDNAFTLSNLQAQLQKKSYPILHMATHGKFGVDAESTFLVGFDQRISIEQIDRLLRSTHRRQPVELLTLSACQTASGDNRSALGIAGVAVRAGVESALATLWYINDQATVPLIEEFYRQLRQSNMTKAQALRAAQIKMITDTNYNHPALWSPFILIGNWL